MQLTIKERETGAVIASGHQNETVRLLEGNWYFEPEAVNMEHLRVTNRVYTCPYKGKCYWIDFQAPGVKATNIAWTYFETKPGYEFIKDRIAFYVRDTVATMAVSEQAVVE